MTKVLTRIADALCNIAQELRRSNEDRVVFYGEMLSFFERLLEDPHAAPKGETRCSAVRGEGEFDRCVNPSGHHGLHVDEVGIAFSEDKGSLRSGRPAAADCSWVGAVENHVTGWKRQRCRVPGDGHEGDHDVVWVDWNPQ